eukprot:3311056-Rhodomonas_salina.1
MEGELDVVVLGLRVGLRVHLVGAKVDVRDDGPVVLIALTRVRICLQGAAADSTSVSRIASVARRAYQRVALQADVIKLARRDVHEKIRPG